MLIVLCVAMAFGLGYLAANTQWSNGNGYAAMFEELRARKASGALPSATVHSGRGNGPIKAFKTLTRREEP